MSGAAHRVAAILALLAWVHPAPASAKAEGRGETSGIVLSRETCSGLFMVPLVWRSERSGREHELLAVFDTGGSSLLIDPDSLERASGRRVEPGRRVRMENVSVAGEGFSTFRPRVRELDHLGRALGRSFDVFLPFAAFDEYLLTLDYPRGELRISKGRLPRPDGTEVFSSRGPDRRPWLSVRIGSRRRPLLIDSGANGTISISRDGGLRWRAPPLPLRLTHGMEDRELSGVGRLAETVKVGPLEFRDPIVSLTRDTELMGEKVLRHFVITFDQEKRRVRLVPAVEGPVRMDPRRGTGAVFHAGPAGLEVVHVIEGSPAARAGLEEGDVATHLDGAPLPPADCYRKYRASTESRRLTILRGEAAFDVTVPLEVLVP